MLRTNMSIVNLNHQQSSSSLLQALVNQRPKSSQKSHSQKRVPSAKSNKTNQNGQPSYKLVTSSLCQPIANIKQEASQRTNETLKPTDNSTTEPLQSQRIQDQQSEKKTNKKASLIQRTIFGQSAASLGIKQKTVKLTRESRSNSKKEVQQIIIEESTQQQQVIKEIENAEATQKLEQLISKYKNTSFFNQGSQQNQQQTQQITPQIVLSVSQPKENQSLSTTQQTLLSQASQAVLQEQDQNVNVVQSNTLQVNQTSINKYVTRISRGANFMPQKQNSNSVNTSVNTKPNRKRMNSPLHGQKRSKENSIVSEQLVSHRESKSKLRNLSGDRKFTQMQKVSIGPQAPFQEFQYYMSFARFFHKDKKFETQIKQLFNNSLKTQQYFCEIYLDHIQQSFHALQFCKDAQKPKLEEIKQKIVNLPPNKFSKSIVFDLDETLIHCQESNDDPSDIVLTIKFPTGETVEAGINIRPYCKDMLQLLSQKYEIIVFTASHECYAQKVLNYLDPDKKFIHHRFFRDSCVVIQDGLHVKDLRVIGNRNLKDMVLIDNASYSFCFQLENGIPIIPFYDNALDKELLYLTTYLMDLMQDQDIPQKNSNNFKTSLFQQDIAFESLITKL
ncbi:unnamed protein product (macronuclear) [Paramecium tetraurelia]|uniref:FCP1 homology domain-containing protein n=1 Tax=Paramecium tetraurelia TaxID=5888 RepID=A0CXW0_PARTE|nr:uncharacterized protein GSPATT00011259001 [Paramecium tetraurelia]CAK75627.1 unnamed protein product [Paramecium tetraurelia]|eukprot:XP_001443024.1 hypothetical protein (macronuclear) [Paramecium tetraurelia strain d4-2]